MGKRERILILGLFASIFILLEILPVHSSNAWLWDIFSPSTLPPLYFDAVYRAIQAVLLAFGLFIIITYFRREKS